MLKALCPFWYFWDTRLRRGSLAFHFTFEWLSAILLAAFFGQGPVWFDLARLPMVYLAFVSIYEIGYICNDFYAARFEQGSRPRGAERFSNLQVLVMIFTRLLSFAALSGLLGFQHNPQWQAFFLMLSLVFSLHNFPLPVELKVITFTWLSVCRFTAPTLFLLRTSYVPALFLSTLTFYSGFRLLPYMDSKGILKMPGRRKPIFRLCYFVSILPLAWFLRDYPGGDLFWWLNLYFAGLALGGFIWAQIRSGNSSARPIEPS
ncbi:hypothetical protein JST97_07310 [bacterium]|nr:hypothetical protein [bacterium]